MGTKINWSGTPSREVPRKAAALGSYYDLTCPADAAALADIDPTYGGPTREEVMNRRCPMCGREGFGGF